MLALAAIGWATKQPLIVALSARQLMNWWSSPSCGVPEPTTLLLDTWSAWAPAFWRFTCGAWNAPNVLSTGIGRRNGYGR